MSVAVQQVGLVYSALGLQASSADADEAEAPDQLLHVLVQPEAWNLKAVQEIGSAQEL